MHLLLVGDVHGRLDELVSLCQEFPGTVVQVGDLGVGFRGVDASSLPLNARFLRGNHDSPNVARRSLSYLGDYGVSDIFGFFFLSGAWSIDGHLRTEGVNWWRDEELSSAQLDQAFDLYRRAKPRLVFTHECPDETFKAMRGYYPQPTATGQALSAMWVEHQPEMWVFGHHHESWRDTVGKTRFRCLDELESAVLDTQTLKWE